MDYGRAKPRSIRSKIFYVMAEMDIYFLFFLYNMNATLVLFALIMALGISAAFVTMVLWPQIADAAGCRFHSQPFNASLGRCLKG